jgi:hypothetical protein
LYNNFRLSIVGAGPFHVASLWKECFTVQGRHEQRATHPSENLRKFVGLKGSILASTTDRCKAPTCPQETGHRNGEPKQEGMDMNVMLTLGVVAAVAAFGGLTVLLLDARSKHLDTLRAHARGRR